MRADPQPSSLLQTLWSALSQILPIASAVSIFLSIWQLKGYLGRFDLLLVNVISLNDAALHFFIIVSWFLPLATLALAYLALPARGRFLACGSALALSILTGAMVLASPEAAAALLRGGLGLGAAVAEMVVLILRRVALPAGVIFALGLIPNAGAVRRSAAASSLALASRAVIAPLLVLLLVMLAVGIGQVRAVSDAARFFAWRDGAGGAEFVYRARLVDAPPRLKACGCGVGVIWSGDRSVALSCGAATILPHDRDELVFETATARLRPALDLGLKALAEAGAQAGTACRTARRAPAAPVA
ncbi:hypothetical protein [Phenylobacterium sp.]|uniref:hypothetical protein n=1 Tax=Phenylobacterium sp. TaxID=1871053 RepID=UPI00286C9991|nr:hypothetical protein [Phenylobacterium sp.]